MDRWIRCEDGCGRCEPNIRDKSFFSIDPKNIIEWTHNILDYVDINKNTIQDFPLDYFISCNNGAHTANYIVQSSTTSPVILRSNILHHIVSDISHYMIIYSIEREYRNITQNYKLPYFYISDINEFK